MTSASPSNSIKKWRGARDWSQQELADRTGLSRAGISAIESGRLAPSVHAAMAIARALETSVEELFQDHAISRSLDWAIPPPSPRSRYWRARVGERTWCYPIADDSIQLDWHDGVARGAPSDPSEAGDRSLVMASCDPAAGLLAAEYARRFQFRMIVLRRNGSESLELLADGKVHVAGVHFKKSEDLAGNRGAARMRLGKDHQLVRVATWEEGLAMNPSLEGSSIESLARRPRWVGREKGSGARQCQDEALGARPAPKRMARDHRMVAAAIKEGWADVGPCVRLASEEAGLPFIKMEEKPYDLCFRSDVAADPRVSALLATIRSRHYRTKLAELPGYRAQKTGEILS